jgi:hypothetical protein
MWNTELTKPSLGRERLLVLILRVTWRLDNSSHHTALPSYNTTFRIRIDLFRAFAFLSLSSLDIHLLHHDMNDISFHFLHYLPLLSFAIKPGIQNLSQNG